MPLVGVSVAEAEEPVIEISCIQELLRLPVLSVKITDEEKLPPFVYV